MLIKEIEKNGRKVWVRDYATERFNKLEKFFKSAEFKLGLCCFMFTAVLILAGLIIKAV